jgi:hypothetical protein
MAEHNKLYKLIDLKTLRNNYSQSDVRKWESKNTTLILGYKKVRI